MPKLRALQQLLLLVLISFYHDDVSGAIIRRRHVPLDQRSFLPFLAGLCANPDSSFQEKLESTTHVSLSDMLSSPERYASSLNMTLEQVQERKLSHRTASAEMNRRLQSKSLSGKEKHALMCQHRLENGRHPFACPKCWSYLPVCVCNLAAPQLCLKQQNLKVVVWTHHREWGLTSNTGSILSLMLSNQSCELLMKGLPEHDRILQDTILNENSVLPIVLWPSNGNDKDSTTTTVSLEEVQEELLQSSNSHRRVVLIAVDGTWRNARRMVARLPSSIPRLDLPEDIVFSSSVSSSSILAPLRSRGESGNDDITSEKRQVCTAEAVVGALQGLGALDQIQAQHILEVTRTKVDRIKRYRGKE